jgi:DNA-binding Xre family transcriptional regulator
MYTFYLPEYNSTLPNIIRCVNKNLAHTKNVDKDKELVLKKLGLRIAQIRQSKNISGIQLSRMIERDDSYMQKVESGKVNVGYYTLCEICDSLGITIQDLV